MLLPWLAWHPPSLSLEQWLLLAAFGIVQMSIPYLLFARGLKSVSAQEASLIALLEPVLTPAWVMMAGWETAETVTWIGGGLIVGGLLLRYTAWAGNAIETPVSCNQLLAEAVRHLGLMQSLRNVVAPCSSLDGNHNGSCQHSNVSEEATFRQV